EVFERLAEESNDANVVRSAYKLIKQIEEFAQLLPEEAAKRTYTRKEESEPTKATRKGKPGRKKMGRPTSKAKASDSNLSGEVKPKGKPGRKKKVPEILTEGE